MLGSDSKKSHLLSRYPQKMHLKLSIMFSEILKIKIRKFYIHCLFYVDMKLSTESNTISKQNKYNKVK